MVYDWEPHRETCRRLWADEGKSMDEVMHHLRFHHDFTPSKRAFQTQFRRWSFPSKHRQFSKDEELLARVKELWERNLTQSEMYRVLTEDNGLDISPRELVRIRTKNRWLLRQPTSVMEKNNGIDDNDGNEMPVEVANMSTTDLRRPSGNLTESPYQTDGSATPQVPAEVVAEREARQHKLEVESAERYSTRKRRRRTREWGGMPADPPGPPRFPSETTLEESKVILALDKQAYNDVRQRFHSICEEADVVKKTLAGPVKWEVVKDRLIADTPHLQTLMWVKKDAIEAKKLALDVICCDVTKRIRSGGKRLLLTDAKNILSLNPEESRQVRSAFYRILKGDNFTSKLAMGPKRFEELKQRWIDESPLLQNILARQDEGGDPSIKVKAVDALARDVMKRLRDDHTKRATKKKARSDVDDDDLDSADIDDMGSGATLDTNAYGQNAVSQMTLVSNGGRNQLHSQSRLLPANVLGPPTGIPLEAQLGSALLLAADTQAPFVEQQFVQSFDAPQAASVFHSQAANTIAIYLRPHHTSTFPVDSGLWIGTLASHSVDDLRRVAAAKYPGAACLRIEGVLKDGKGGEVPLQINQDQELAAYLTHEQGAPTFNVQLVHGWNPN